MKILLFIILIPLSALLIAGLFIIIHVMILLYKRPLKKFYKDRRQDADFIPLSRMPFKLVHFVLRIEDDGFFQHPGFSTMKIRDAVYMNLHSRSIQTGGSSMTQQLVKNLFFRFEKSYIRKIEEFIITIYAEHVLEKTQLFELYMNIVYFGSGIYGITHASWFYFNKKVEDLTTNQMFLLAVLLYAPTKSNPLWYPDVLERIRDKRMKMLIRRGELSDKDIAIISSHHADCLDPDLQSREDIRDTYPRDICLVNDRFGLPGRKERVTIPSPP